MGEFQVSVKSDHVRITMSKETVESIPSTQQCANCSLDLVGDYGCPNFYTLPITGQKITTYEALKGVFKGYETPSFQSLNSKDSIQFCNACVKVFRNLLRYYTEFLQLTNLNSIIRKLLDFFGIPDQFVNKLSSGTGTPVAPFIVRVQSLQSYSSQEKVYPNHKNRIREVSDFSNRTESENHESDSVNNPMTTTMTGDTSKRGHTKNPVDLYKCEICGKKFQYYLKKRMHKEAEHEGLRKFRCSRCDCEYSTINSLRRHEREKHKIYQQNTSVNTFKCEICGKDFQKRFHLIMHKEAEHEGIRKYRCTMCVYSYKREDSLRKHESLNHSINELKQRFLTLDEDKHLLVYENYKCNTDNGCETVSLSTFKEWVLHQQDIHKIDTGYKDVEKEETLEPINSLIRPCPKCGKRLKKNSDVIRHMKIAHLNLPTFKCSACDKGFITQKELVLHKKSVHEETEEKYLCNLCGALLTSIVSLKNHEKKHYEKEPTLKAECNICYKKVSSNSKLKEHMASVHSSDGKLYNCDQCDNKYKTERSLNIHKKYTHVLKVTLPHPCPLCNRRFPMKSKLKIHLMSSTHKLTKDEAESTANIKKKLFRILPNGDRVYPQNKLTKSRTCGFCDRTYSRLDILYVHLVQTHGKTEEEAKDITKFETKRKNLFNTNKTQQSTRRRKTSTTNADEAEAVPSSSTVYNQNYYEQQQNVHNYNLRY